MACGGSCFCSCWSSAACIAGFHPNYERLTGRIESVGVGGVSQDYTELGLVLFSDPEFGLRGYWLDFIISAPSDEITDMPSLLGRDVIER